jgi:pyruvate/2-oxoglutarate dehydrogenase complex dihydrolipoamide acyltransferase (E2) component
MEPFMAAPTPTVDRMPPDAGAQHQAPAEIEATQEAPGQLNVGKYNLYAVIVHSGYGVHSGHYYAYVRDGLGRWYLCDDNIVRAVQESDVLRSEAYILAYTRAPPAPQATPQKPPAPHTAVGASTVPNEVEAGANNAPPSPPQIARSSGVAWNMVRKRVAGSGSHVDPGVVALGKSCDEYLQAVRPWTASVTETLRQTAATFRKQHGRPAGVEELVHAWEKEHKKRSWELLQCPQTTTVMDEWCDAAEQLLRKHARGEETIERDQSPGGPAI